MTLPRELKDFTASLSEPVIFVSDEGIVRWVNGSAQGLLAGDCGRLAGTALQLLVDDPVEHVNAFLRLCFRTRRPVPGRLRWRVRAPSQPPRERCTGVLIPGSDVHAPNLVCIRILPLSHGSIASFELLNKKIGNLNNALRALAESQKQLQQERDSAVVTLYSIGDAVITTDADGRVQRLNPVAARLTGWNENEAVGRQLSEVFRIVNEDTREPADDLVRQCLREGRIVGLANHTLLIA